MKLKDICFGDNLLKMCLGKIMWCLLCLFVKGEVIM